jgi:co-chaperonin GroES (HSP10)
MKLRCEEEEAQRLAPDRANKIMADNFSGEILDRHDTEYIIMNRMAHFFYNKMKR